MYECFNCGERSVSWDADFDYEGYGLEGSGIVHVCHCNNCGARITYEIDTEEDETDMTAEESTTYDNGFFNGYTRGFAEGQKARAEFDEEIIENRTKAEYKKGFEDGRNDVLKMIPTLMDELQKAYEEGQHDS